MKLRAASASVSVLLLLAVGCKPDAPGPAAGSSAAPAGEPSGRARSAKIQIDRPQLPRGEPQEDDRPREDGARRGGWGDPDATADERRARWSDRRKQREIDLDANQDGTISPEEVTAARTARAEAMRARLDTDGDGKLTVAEAGESRMSRRFGDPDQLDTDKNGEISVEELAGSLERMRGRMRGPGRELPDEAAGSGSAAP